MSVTPASTARRLPDSPHGRRELADLHRQQAMAWKRTVWALKDEVENRRYDIGICRGDSVAIHALPTEFSLVGANVVN